MSKLPLRVVKVGCSLFERRQLAEQLRAWLRAQSPAIHVLFAGGGELADAIRTWDERFQIGEANCHWLCIEALSITAQVLQQASRGFPLLRDFSELQRRIGGHRQFCEPESIVFDVRQFLSEVESSSPPIALPHRWQVTTDSIAARLAEVLGADELVLLKSRPCPAEQSDFAMLAEQGFVDDYFPQIAPRIAHVRLCQL